MTRWEISNSDILDAGLEGESVVISCNGGQSPKGRALLATIDFRCPRRNAKTGGHTPVSLLFIFHLPGLDGNAADNKSLLLDTHLPLPPTLNTSSLTVILSLIPKTLFFINAFRREQPSFSRWLADIKAFINLSLLIPHTRSTNPISKRF